MKNINLNFFSMLPFFLLIRVIGFGHDIPLAEEYKILHIKGNIILKKTGLPLTTGDRISSEEQIQFGSPDALAIVYSTQKGRWLLESKKATGSSVEAEKLWSFVKDNLTSHKTVQYLSTKGNVPIVNLKNYFYQDSTHSVKGQFLIAGQNCALPLSKQNYRLSADNFFFINYSINGEKITKKLSFSENTLVLKKEDFLNSKGILAESVSLWYHNPVDSDEPQLTAEFSPVFAEETAFKKECNTVINALKPSAKDSNGLRRAFYEYLLSAYGNFDEANIKNWLKLNNISLAK